MEKVIQSDGEDFKFVCQESSELGNIYSIVSL